MQVYRHLDSIPPIKNAVVTIGTFDGLHNGHKKIIRQLKAEAEKIDGESVVITFHPHPRKVVGDTSGVKLLTTTSEKIELFEQMGVQHLAIVPFNDAFSSLTAEAYITDFLVAVFRPHTIIIGYDHCFGKGRKGNYQLLEKFGAELGFAVKEISEAVANEAAISSTRIRRALLQHEIAVANELLGYPYFFGGEVIEGDKIGRTIGYPTANIQIDDDEKLVPADGIYAATAFLKKGDKPIEGMLYIGSRPVVNGKRRVIEMNLFNFNDMIYGEEIRVAVHAFIREDKPLKDLEALREQLFIDKEACLAFFSKQA